MTLQQASLILNDRRHRGITTWCPPRNAAELPAGSLSITSYPPDPCNELEAFEAIAIAEKYQRGGH